MGEEGQDLLREDLLVPEDLNIMVIKMTIEAGTHLGGETHLGGDQTRQEERNLSVKIVNGHTRQIGFLSIPGALGANARLASKSGRSLWILWQRKQRLG